MASLNFPYENKDAMPVSRRPVEPTDNIAFCRRACNVIQSWIDRGHGTQLVVFYPYEHRAMFDANKALLEAKGFTVEFFEDTNELVIR